MSQLAHYLTHLQRFGIKPGLERMHRLLELAGQPHLNYPVLLVGGTNGKGSTCEFLARALAASGKRVGLYTSPHLYFWNERIRVLEGAVSREDLFSGQATDAELDCLLQEALPHIEAIRETEGQTTEFEVMTLLGFWYFARRQVDAAIIEVGLGGHFDATNVSDPLVSVVTHVALDHCDRLGSTLEAIAADKAHIARPGRPLVTAATHPGVLQVLEDHCRQVGSHLVRVNPAGTEEAFQQRNWRTAATAGKLFCGALGWPDVFQGEVPGQVPGRFETISQAPRIILDGANNPDGAELLRRSVQADASISRESLIVVLGILADKDYEAMTAILAPLGRTVIATASNSPRAASAQTIATLAAQYCTDVHTVPTVPAAVAHAKTLAAPGDTILITGSFTTVGEVDRA